MSKSKKYEIDGKSYYFSFDKNSKLNGISEVSGSGSQFRETPVNPSTKLFETLSTSDDALDALNVNKFKGATTQTSMEIASAEELNQNYNQKLKKSTNEDLNIKPVDPIQSASVGTDEFGTSYDQRGYALPTDRLLAYPFDIDPQQDHLKITKYKYTRPGVQASRPASRSTETVPVYKYTKTRNLNTQQLRKGMKEGYTTKIGTKDIVTNAAGDSVINTMEPLGSVLLPMPKVVDTNGADWGESKLNIFGLAAVSIGDKLALGRLGLSQEKQEEIKKIQNNISQGRTSGLKDIGGALGASGFSQTAATAAGINIDQNAFLARSSGRVLNPNAELLFQGPVLRDFNFDFLMIARSRKEGESIRKIIRFFKLGMAPQFNNSTFLNTPDVFTLAYKRGQGELDDLDTVNRFNPGGLALRTIAVDYAPSGYWSAYQDSQPVALKMSLNFAELRPIYRGDQEQTPMTSVGY
tara:strand:- start:711 stop:2108 length:1398 start_codon:yes stop_codon:yes gene_type:complete